MTSTATTPVLPDSPAALLREVAGSRARAESEDVRLMELTIGWADLHPAVAGAEACFISPKTFAGEGSPVIDDFCVPEHATTLGRTCDSTGRFLTECLELAHRLPRLWSAVRTGAVTGWRARMIAASTVELSQATAAFVDSQVCWCANRVTPAELNCLLDQARVRYMPALLPSWRRCRWTSVMSPSTPTRSGSTTPCTSKLLCRSLTPWH